MKDKIIKFFVPKVTKFANLKGVLALKDGMTSILTATVVGSIFLLLAEFPYEPIKVFFVNIGLTPYLMQVYTSTFNLLSLICAFSIAYCYAKNENIDPLGNAITSVISFMIVSNQYILVNGEKVSGVISMGNILGSRGIICAIIISLISSYIYTYCVKNKIIIKMPDSVPQGVANSFSALIPGFIIMTLSVGVYGIINVLTNGDLVDLIYKIIQLPLLNLTDSFFGVIIISLMIPLLWWFGIHGNNVVGGVMTGIWLSALASNQEILNKGLELTLQNGGRIYTYQFNYILVCMTGSGVTMGMVIAMLLSARSKQYKEISKLSIIPAIFNINEPIIFGCPVVFNTSLFIPFLSMPIITAIISYVSIRIGLVPMFAGVNPPWTTPPILSGLLAGGPRMAILQIVIIIVSIVVYYPFVIMMDKKAYKEENKEK